MIRKNPVTNLPDGTRVSVSFEGTVRGSQVVPDEGQFMAYENLLVAAKVEVIKSPVKVGDFFVTDDFPSKQFVGLAVSEEEYITVKGIDFGGHRKAYNIGQLHNRGYRVATHEEVTAALNPASTSTDAEWD